MKIFLNNEQNFVIHIFEKNTIVMMMMTNLFRFWLRIPDLKREFTFEFGLLRSWIRSQQNEKELQKNQIKKDPAFG